MAERIYLWRISGSALSVAPGPAISVRSSGHWAWTERQYGNTLTLQSLMDLVGQRGNGVPVLLELQADTKGSADAYRDLRSFKKTALYQSLIDKLMANNT